MSANVKAEAILIVIKRILKWTGFALLAGVVLIVIFSSYDEFQRYQRDKPRLVTEYAGVKLGETHEHVKYVLGNPPEFLIFGTKDSNDGDLAGPRLIQTNDKNEGHLISQSDIWLYPDQQTTKTIDFDKPGGVITSITCITQTTYGCPAIFGIRHGTEEDRVLEHLGKPDAEVFRDSVKVLRYNRYNMTLYLTRKAVYMLEVTASSKSVDRVKAD
jgi:hypothetical protein